ncbi:MAG: AgmX/PglI C-terminal domain-containing protein [Bacteriovoracales bacterium]
MIYTGKERRQFFELSPKGRRGKAFLIDKRRTMIGSSESCDVVLKFSDISPIHAILEITKEGARIYDLNTPAGTFLNGKKVTVGEYKEGDFLSFGPHEFIYRKFVEEDAPPPVLEMLNPITPPKPKAVEPKLPPIPVVKGVKIPPKETHAPRIAYPLALDPKADYSGYIYEETEKLYPIFKYEYEKNSVEVLIHFGEKIYSVDFLTPRKGRYQLVGMGDAQLEFPILGKEEKVDFIEVNKKEARVFPLSGYEILALNDQKKTGGSILLEEDDLLVFTKGQTKIFVRKTPPPPKVAAAPFFQRGGNFSKVLLGVYAVVIVLLFFISGINVEEVKKKQEEEAPKRIAQILYKPKPVEVKPVEPPPKPIEVPLVKAQEKPAVPTSPLPGTSKEQVVQIKKADVTEFERKRPPKTPPQKGVPPQAKKEIKKSLITKTVSEKKGLPPPPKTKGRPAPPGTVVARKGGGNVEAFKLDFKPNVSKVLQKGESFASDNDYGTPPGSRTSEEEIGVVGGVGAGGAATVKKQGMGSKVGSLSGATRGSLDTSTGVSGLSDKESVYTVGIPGKTVILGGMDPDVIKRILDDNLNLIQSCYQREIEEESGSFSGVVKVRFVIGASGRVSEANASSDDRSLTQKVIGCIVGVIRDIKFPRPPGGGIIEVVQPFNLQSAKRG